MASARPSDPVSSHVAAQGAAEFAAAHRLAILKLLSAHPSSTAQELATHSDLDRYQIGRRMVELERRGQITRDGIRTCSIGHKVATAWSLVAR